MPRELDIEVAVDVLGLVATQTQPDWYPIPVTTFRDPDFPDWIAYSYDENACNAMPYQNGRDGSTAPPLPRFSGEMECAWEICGAMNQRGFALSLMKFRDYASACFIAEGGKEYPAISALESESDCAAAEAICHAALSAVRQPAEGSGGR